MFLLHLLVLTLVVSCAAKSHLQPISTNKAKGSNNALKLKSKITTNSVVASSEKSASDLRGLSCIVGGALAHLTLGESYLI